MDFWPFLCQIRATEISLNPNLTPFFSHHTVLEMIYMYITYMEQFCKPISFLFHNFGTR